MLQAVAQHGGWDSVRAQDSKPQADVEGVIWLTASLADGFHRVAQPPLADERERRDGAVPFAFCWLPSARLSLAADSAEHVQETVVVEIEQSDAFVLSGNASQRLFAGQILVQPFHRLLERQEFHLLAVGAFGVVDELDDLVIAEPAVRMEDRGEDTLRAHDGVQGELPVGDGGGVGGAVGVEGFPVARDHRGEFPAGAVDDVGIGIVLDVGAEIRERFFCHGVGCRGEVAAEVVGGGKGGWGLGSGV